jgi:lipoprotein NlpD
MHNIVKSDSFARVGQRLSVVAIAAVLAACANSPMPAPVVDTTTAGAPSRQPPPSRRRPDTIGSSEAIRFTVSRSKMASRIAMWRLNNMANANQIEVGQLLRVVPPSADVNAAPGVATAPVAPGVVQSQPIDSARPAARLSARRPARQPL